MDSPSFQLMMNSLFGLITRQRSGLCTPLLPSQTTSTSLKLPNCSLRWNVFSALGYDELRSNNASEGGNKAVNWSFKAVDLHQRKGGSVKGGWNILWTTTALLKSFTFLGRSAICALVLFRVCDFFTYLSFYFANFGCILEYLITVI